MAGSVNKVILVGNLGRDPEIRNAQDGTKIANFSVATSESWRDKATGERKERTQWHRVVVFNDRLADVAQQYLKKGMKVFVEGQLKSRKYPDKETGQEREITEVVIDRFRGDFQMLDSRGGPGADPGNGGDRESSYSRSGSARPAAAKDFDDDIPF
ncbi:MAG: single-stranded DNA-binding protein [Rhodospirillaceae bacterium]|nr:single-stranded DNA-binding protein [Rhodospirillaceae bacterium]